MGELLSIHPVGTSILGVSLMAVCAQTLLSVGNITGRSGIHTMVLEGRDIRQPVTWNLWVRVQWSQS